MRYGKLLEAEFVERLNRFVAVVNLNGELLKCHVRNTGRLKELLIPQAKVFIEESDNSSRKYKYSLIQVMKGDIPVNIDSQAPNRMALEWAKKYFGAEAVVKPEQTFGDSRFDLYVETGVRRIFVEVKGVTLEHEQIAYFPDAPTERGVKHLYELAESVKQGYEAYILFVIQMKGVGGFSPNDSTQPVFGEALRYAVDQGVKALAYDCVVSGGEVYIDKPVPVKL